MSEDTCNIHLWRIRNWTNTNLHYSKFQIFEWKFYFPLQLEYILHGKQDFLTSKIMLPSSPVGGGGNDVRTKIDPDTQARLEALLEAAGKLPL